MYKHLLVPVVFDDDHDTPASFDVARALAGEGAEITVLHVVETVPNYLFTAALEQAVEGHRQEAARLVKEMAAKLPNATAHLTAGKPGRAIVDYASEHNADCIVLASHQPGFEDLFIGSTAAFVVRHAGCAVHVLR